jgi:sporulation protein YlmC with PRC-barrel domain
MADFRESQESHGTLVRQSQLVDRKVRNLENESVGKIEDLMIDANDGRIVYAVLSFGGFLGMGNKLFAVPWPSLTFDTVRDEFVLNVDKDKLKSAPGFDKTDWPNMSEPRWRNEIHRHYGHPGMH